MSLSLARARELMVYDPCSGILTWRPRVVESFTCGASYRQGLADRWNAEKAGRQVGCVGPLGYRQTTINGKTYRAHQIAWLLHFGEWPGSMMDHVNHRRDDNRIENLRLVTSKENACNRRLDSRSKTGATGVCRRESTDRWRASVFVDGKKREIGSYKTKGEAVAARKAAEKELNYHPNHGS